MRIISRKKIFLKIASINDESKIQIERFNINPEISDQTNYQKTIRWIKEIPIEKEIEPDLSTQNKKSLLYYLPSNKK